MKHAEGKLVREKRSSLPQSFLPAELRDETTPPIPPQNTQQVAMQTSTPTAPLTNSPNTRVNNSRSGRR